MQDLKGKHVVCFIALPVHARYLLPVSESLKDRGAKVTFLTAAAEAAFELTLLEADVPYRHALDYADQALGGSSFAGIRFKAEYDKLRNEWQRRLLADPALRVVTTVIQDKVLRQTAETYACYAAMMRIERPDLILALHEMNSWGKILGHLADQHGVPYLTLQEGLYYGPLAYYRGHAEYSTCAVWGEATKEILVAAGADPAKVYVMGNVDLDVTIERCTHHQVMMDTRAQLGVGPSQRLVLFLMSYHRHELDAKPLQAWLKKHPDVMVVFKWHPMTTPADVKVMAAKMGPQVKHLHMESCYPAIAASAACVIVGNSTIGLEAIAFGRRLVEMHVDDYPHSFAKQGVALAASNLVEAMELALGEEEPPLVTLTSYLARQLSRTYSYPDNAVAALAAKLILRR